MARKKLELSNIFPYHVRARSNNREWFALPQERCWNTFCDYLAMIQMQFEVKIHSYILMSNHFHIELTTPLANLPQIMNRFMTEFAFATNDQANRINHVFGGQYKATIIKDPSYSYSCHKYILTNSVRAGICDDPLIYPYSSLQTIFGLRKSWVTLEPPVFGNPYSAPESYLKWLKTPISERLALGIRKSLKRKEFRLSQDVMSELVRERSIYS